jgi:hypothetical protein
MPKRVNEKVVKTEMKNSKGKTNSKEEPITPASDYELTLPKYNINNTRFV